MFIAPESNEVRHSVRSAMSPLAKNISPLTGWVGPVAPIYKHATPGGVGDSWQQP
jgi:hypothetical protein